MPDGELIRVLTEIQRRGGIGPVDLGEAIAHARRYLSWIDGDAGRLVDLGSGGGLPGLVLAHDVPGWSIWLVERRAARADLLRYGVGALTLGMRVRVVGDDVARWARQWSMTADVVTARSYAAPLRVLAEASPLLAPGGLVLIGDAPGAPTRWSEDDLVRLGYDDAGSRDGIHAFRRT